MDPPILCAERLVWLYERYTAHNRWIHGGGFHCNRAESLIKVGHYPPGTKNQDSQKSFAENLGSWNMGGKLLEGREF